MTFHSIHVCPCFCFLPTEATTTTPTTTTTTTPTTTTTTTPKTTTTETTTTTPTTTSTTTTSTTHEPTTTSDHVSLAPWALSLIVLGCIGAGMVIVGTGLAVCYCLKMRKSQQQNTCGSGGSYVPHAMPCGKF
ncbi:zinc metalloproteinase nas-34-like [Podarcis raffonei]|uniref:zinc metalloproteinase nas-34-like n=1 Tax=Podarcis raffonei TaxID=65483 RepID=UPI0023299B40|nr:zinc metalloproteinase nas-34-like [Podarcis raffonei]